ncbi:hypothetical protein NA56DRAFT_705674 [Hyaloscypha hepaticicola]|uniref:Uncharacterized protein n=1 Tax=Hyaloscypha hepaticicola TaxID=2082293 RepID=A0A2J6PZX4_9HELO|nr:hypothetical protein NA56DRAFT_705674 [Hyaloscypha hepaticicola]
MSSKIDNMASPDPEPEFINFYTPRNEDFYAAKLYRPLNPDNDDFRLLEILPARIGSRPRHWASKMRIFYERAECVIAWLGILKGGEIALQTVRELQDEYDTKMEYMTDDGTSTKENLVINSIANDSFNEMLSDSPEALARYEAVGNLFRSELWSRVWI